MNKFGMKSAYKHSIRAAPTGGTGVGVRSISTK